MQGRLISQGNISDQNQINIKNYTNGMYFIKFENGTIKRIVKK